MSFLVVLGLATLLHNGQAPTTAAIVGVVVEEGTGTPVPDAQLTLYSTQFRPGPGQPPPRPLTAVTDREGRFRFEGVTPGIYRLGAYKTGFAQELGPQLPPVELKAGQRHDVGAIALKRGGVIVGRVLDEHGEPLLEARVMAMRRPPLPAGATNPRRDMLLPAGGGAQTNDLGEFRLFGLAPGEYYVQATPRSYFGGATSQQARALLPTFFPETADAAGAESITVTSGQTSSPIVIRMIGAPAFQVSGLVVDEAGKPVANAMVRLFLEDAGGPPMMMMMGRGDQSRTDASGRFSLNNVTPGGYTLLAIAPQVFSSPAAGRSGAGSGGSGGYSWSSSSGGIVSGTVGSGVTTETSNGTTFQYRDDLGTRVPVTIDQSNVTGLRVTVRRGSRD